MLLEATYGLLAVAALIITCLGMWLIHFHSEFRKLKEYVLKLEADRLKAASIIEAAEELANHRGDTLDQVLDMIVTCEDIPKAVKTAIIAVKFR